MYFLINDNDYSHMVSALKVGYETLVSNDSGRNANGDTVIDVINKKHKLYVTFRHTTAAEMQSLLNAVSDYVVNVSYRNPVRQSIDTITAYTGTPEADYYTISDKTIFKPMSLNFVEL